MDNFIECVRTRKAPNCDAELGYRTMTAIALGILAYRQNRVMVFDPSRQRLLT
jgi:cobalamin biosynthesis protein CobD/CbiB